MVDRKHVKAIKLSVDLIQSLKVITGFGMYLTSLSSAICGIVIMGKRVYTMCLDHEWTHLVYGTGSLPLHRVHNF